MSNSKRGNKKTKVNAKIKRDSNKTKEPLNYVIIERIIIVPSGIANSKSNPELMNIVFPLLIILVLALVTVSLI